jgi:ABC-type Mn2+/Zn2+ transport system permease subunit
MQNLLMAIVLSGVACAWLGVHVTLRKMSFFGDALAHSTLPGVVLAHVFGLHMLLGALVSLNGSFGSGLGSTISQNQP